MKWLAVLALVLLAPLVAVAGHAAPYDDDGEGAVLAAAPPANRTARPVVVDTDLAGEDLVALAFLLRHPDVRVEAVTIAATGLVRCEAGADVVAGVFAATQELPVPVACGREKPGAGAREWPAQWREVAERGTGVAPVDGELDPRPAEDLIADLATRPHEVTVVALGPLTNLADLGRHHPRAYARLAGIHAMAGLVDGQAVDGVAEWNVAADPEATAAVLAGPAPLTIVPDDAIPAGTPAGQEAPFVRLVAAVIDYPKWWDTATSAVFVDPGAGTVQRGRWVLDGAEPGRLVRAGRGPVRVYRSLDWQRLDAAYGEVFVAR